MQFYLSICVAARTQPRALTCTATLRALSDLERVTELACQRHGRSPRGPVSLNNAVPVECIFLSDFRPYCCGMSGGAYVNKPERRIRHLHDILTSGPRTFDAVVVGAGLNPSVRGLVAADELGGNARQCCPLETRMS